MSIFAPYYAESDSSVRIFKQVQVSRCRRRESSSVKESRNGRRLAIGKGRHSKDEHSRGRGLWCGSYAHTRWCAASWARVPHTVGSREVRNVRSQNGEYQSCQDKIFQLGAEWRAISIVDLLSTTRLGSQKSHYWMSSSDFRLGQSRSIKP